MIEKDNRLFYTLRGYLQDCLAVAHFAWQPGALAEVTQKYSVFDGNHTR